MTALLKRRQVLFGSAAAAALLTPVGQALARCGLNTRGVRGLRCASGDGQLTTIDATSGVSVNVNAMNFVKTTLHPQARLRVGFRQTLVADDSGNNGLLPRGTGDIDVHDVRPFADKLSPLVTEVGGAAIPLRAGAEALFLDFTNSSYPFAVKVYMARNGKFVNAVTGEVTDETNPVFDASRKDYLITSGPGVTGDKYLDGIVNRATGGLDQFKMTGGALGDNLSGLYIVAAPMNPQLFRSLAIASAPLVKRGINRGSDPVAEIDATGGKLEQGFAVVDPFLQNAARANIAPNNVWLSAEGLAMFAHMVGEQEWVKAGGPAIRRAALTGDHYLDTGWYSPATGGTQPKRTDRTWASHVQGLCQRRDIPCAPGTLQRLRSMLANSR